MTDEEIISAYHRISDALKKTRHKRVELMTPEQIKKGFELHQAIQNTDIALTEGTFVKFEFKTHVLKSDAEVIKLCEDTRKELADKIKDILIDRKNKMMQELNEV